MSKSILLIDTPQTCLQCPMLNGGDEYTLQTEDENFNADTFQMLRENCPMKVLPEGKNDEFLRALLEEMEG